MATNGNDIIFGTAGNNTIDALAGNDAVYALAGNDTLMGGLGNDRLNGGLGNDTVNGGSGTDTADYSSGTVDPPGPIGSTPVTGASSGVTVNLNLTGAQNTGGAGVDTLVSIENIFGTKFNDTLTGNGSNNVLSGLAGNDRLLGGNGNDLLNGGAGNDRLNGGAGLDTASYSSATGDVTVDLDLPGVAQNTGGAGTDTLTSIENLIGSKFNDTLNSAFIDNSTIKGGAGNDRLTTDHSTNFTLYGDDGNDDLLAGPGIGTLNGGAGHDTLFAGDGTFTLNGGAGNDMLTIEIFLGGKSTLNGGAGADILEHLDPPFPGGIVTFDYNAVSDSPAGAGRDAIINFVGVNGFDEADEHGDRIDLTGVDANSLVSGNQAFKWIGNNAFTAAGQLRYSGGILSGNTDGDAAAEFEIQLTGCPALFVQAGHAGSDILL